MPLGQALRLASSAFGVPVKLPDTSVLKPSDANQTATVEWVLPHGPGPLGPVSGLTVQFPTAYVDYRLTDSSDDPPNAVDEYKAEIAETATNPADGPPPAYQIVHLSDGTPGLIGLSPRGNTIEFRAGPLSIDIYAPSQPDGTPTTIDASAIQALAQSIEDQTTTSS